MKNALVLFFAVLPLFSFSKSRESIPEWSIGEQKKDAGLQSTESILEMHFNRYYYSQDDTKKLPQIKYSLNGKTDSIPFPLNGVIDLRVKPGSYIGQFFAGPDYYEVKTDSFRVNGGYRLPVHINFHSSVTPVIEDKPVIYVYSPQPVQVNIQMQINGTMGFTYPAYNNGWNFIADREGNIYMNDKTYPYLFWEATTGLDNDGIDWSEGFMVKRDSLVPFFERVLASMGMNEREITDYITYWVPKMSASDSCYIHFMMNEDYDEYAAMNVTPAPDAKLQVYMIWTDGAGVQGNSITPQLLPSFERNGLTIVEWGGSEIPCVPVIFEDMFTD